MKQTVGIENSIRHVQELQPPVLKDPSSEGDVTVSTSNIDRAWILWLNRRVLLRRTAVGCAVFLAIAFLIPNQYEATTKLMPPDSRSGGALGSGLAMMAAMSGQPGAMASSALGGLASDVLGMKDAGAVFTDMLRSRTVQDRLVAKFDLRKVYRTRYWENARKTLADHTVIIEDRKSGIITITVDDHDPNRAAQLAQAYVDELDRIAADVSTSAARRERLFIEQRLKTVKQDLDTASQRFSEYASKNATLDLKEQGKATVEAAAVLQGQLIAAQSELQGLEQIYTDNNVRVKALKARVDELSRQLKKVGGHVETNGSTSVDSDQEFPSIRQLPVLGVRWADLYRDTRVQETVYELLTEQYEQSKIQEAKETPVVKVLDAPVVPERKSRPPRLLIVLLGTGISFITVGIWILGNASWNEIDPSDPRKQLCLEILAGATRRLKHIIGKIKRTRQSVGRNDSGEGNSSLD